MMVMARGGGSWRRGVVLWTGMLALIIALAVIGLTLQGKGGLQAAANVAQLVSVGLAIPALAVPLWLWSRRSLSGSGDLAGCGRCQGCAVRDSRPAMAH
jgi:hypothetical protein